MGRERERHREADWLVDDRQLTRTDRAGLRARVIVTCAAAAAASFHEIGMRVADWPTRRPLLFDFRRRQYRRHQSNRKRGSECG